MKVFLFDEKLLSVINRKEEITDDTCLIDDFEYEKIKETLDNGGYFWRIDRLTVGCSGKAPSADHKFNEETHEWEICPEKVAQRLNEERAIMWDKIKTRRAKAVASGVEVDGNWYHTDDEARSNYYALTAKLVLGEDITRQWKTMDGKFITMTNELFKRIADELDRKKVTADFFNAERLFEIVKNSQEPLNVDIENGWSLGYE